MLTRIGNVVWKEALQFWRYKLLLIFILVFPAMNMLAAEEAVSAEILHIPTAVYDQDRSSTSRQLIKLLEGSHLFAPHTYVSSQEEMEGLLERGTVKVGVIIPPNFASDLLGGDRVTVQVLQDGTETMTSLLAGAYLEGASYVYARRMTGGGGKPAVAVERIQFVDPRSRVWFNEDLRRENFQLPAELAASVAMLATFLPAVAIVQERERGTLEQLFVTPIRSVELVLSKGILSAGIAFVGFLEALAVITLYEGVPLRGSLPLLLVLTGFYIFVEMGFGLLISAVVRTQGQALLAAFFWLMLESILSGQILPVENMPVVVQWVSRLMPNTHFTTIVRTIMLRGGGLADLWPQLVALVFLGIALYGLAVSRMQKRLD